MTWDEVEKKVTDLISNPDTAAEKAVSFLDDLKTDYSSFNSMTEKSEQDEKRIRDLQDTNQKLFLSVTGQPKEEEEEKEETQGIDWDKILNEREEEK